MARAVADEVPDWSDGGPEVSTRERIAAEGERDAALGRSLARHGVRPSTTPIETIDRFATFSRGHSPEPADPATVLTVVLAMKRDDPLAVAYLEFADKLLDTPGRHTYSARKRSVPHRVASVRQVSVVRRPFVAVLREAYDRAAST